MPVTFVASQTTFTAARTAARSLSASATVHGTREHAARSASDPLRAPNIADNMVPSAPMTTASSKAGHSVGSTVATRTALIQGLPAPPPQVTDTVLAELRNAAAKVTVIGRLTGDDISVAPEQVYPVAEASTETSTRTLLEDATQDTASTAFAPMPGGTQRLAHRSRLSGGSESERLSEPTTTAPGERRNASARGAADGEAARNASDEGDGDSELVGTGGRAVELRVNDTSRTNGGMLGVSDRECVDDGEIKEDRRGEVDGDTTAV